MILRTEGFVLTLPPEAGHGGFEDVRDDADDHPI
jgi:hypothetical protein